METEETYKQLKAKLRGKMEHGDIKTIAERIGKNPVYISSILSPSNNSYNDLVVAEAVKIIAEREERRGRMLKQLGS